MMDMKWGYTGSFDRRGYSVSELGHKAGISNRKINKLLEKHGFQTGHRDWNDTLYWVPTEKAKPFARSRSYEGEVVGGILEWRLEVLKEIGLSTDVATMETAEK